MRITGTFLDEISHDIASQNWGFGEWDREFRVFKDIGIDTVILIRCGYLRWMTWPSKVLEKRERAFVPSLDLVDLYLALCEKYGIDFYFGLYDSGRYWISGEYQKEVDLNLAVADEVWSMYGNRPAFKGWYLSIEVGKKEHSIVDIYCKLGKHCKNISGGLPVLISPFINGVKTPHLPENTLKKTSGLTPEEHEKEWDQIFSGISDVVDIVAFQDGGAGWDYLDEYLAINKTLAAKHNMRCWSNSENFDRDTRIKFPPIKWEKLKIKLDAAERSGVEKAITFEFSHFMSPNASDASARNLFKRYCEYAEIEFK
jgi:hypothetical protein